MRTMIARFPLFPGAFLLALALTALADPGIQDFIQAQRAFENSLAGDKHATGAAIERFQALVDADPAQPLYLAYLGSAHTLKARDAWMPWTRMQYVEKGLDIIDKALSMLGPEHDEQALRGSIVGTETRLVAISTFLKVPGFLNRRQSADDLLAETLNTPAFFKAPPEVKGRLWLQAAELARLDKDPAARRGYLEKAAAILPAGRYANLTRQQLNSMERQDDER